MGLGQLDSLEIAAKLQRKEIAQMPKFLSEEDEKAVKKALSFLRSSSYAIKAWMLQEAAIQAKANTLRMAEARWSAYADSLRKAGTAGGRCAALRRAETKVAQVRKSLETLNPTSEARRYADLEKRLDRAEARFSAYIWERIDEGDKRYSIKEGIESERAVAFVKKAEGKEMPNLSFLQSDPQGATLLKSYAARVRNITCELRKMGFEPSYSLEAKRSKAETARAEAREANAEAREAVSRLAHAKEVEATAIEQAHLAGQFYLVAALGEAIEEFGNSLAY